MDVTGGGFTYYIGEEKLLKQLEGEWESVLLQTSWKLEPCSKPARHEKSTERSSPTDLETTAPPSEQTNNPAAAPTIANSQNPNTTNESDNFLLVEGENQTRSN